jgi:hypothetical protein
VVPDAETRWGQSLIFTVEFDGELSTAIALGIALQTAAADEQTKRVDYRFQAVSSIPSNCSRSRL